MTGGYTLHHFTIDQTSGARLEMVPGKKFHNPNGLCADLQQGGEKETKIMEEEMVVETRGTGKDFFLSFINCLFFFLLLLIFIYFFKFCKMFILNVSITLIIS